MEIRALFRLAGTVLVAFLIPLASWSEPMSQDELDRWGMEAPSEPDDRAQRPPRKPDGPPLSVTVILQNGDVPAGGGGVPVTTIDPPFTNGDGEVGFNGTVDFSDEFIWFDSSLIFLDTSVGSPGLFGGEPVMGIGNNGEFVYSTFIDGDDGLWTDLGQLAREHIQAPGFPAGTISTFHSRPTMDHTGQVYWVAGLNSSGGVVTQGRALYTSTDRTPATITPIFAWGDRIGGFTISNGSAVDFDYDFSGDGSHHIHVLTMETGSTANDNFLYVDGALVAREGNAVTGPAENWSNFDVSAINDSGQYLIAGNTDAATGTDEFIAYGVSPGAPTIAVREGDVVDGVTLTSNAFVRGVAVNNDGCAAHTWSVSGGDKHVFIGEAGRLASTSDLVFSTGDAVDVDDDGMADATVTDVNDFFAISLTLNEAGVLYVEVDLDYGGGDLEAILAINFNGASCVVPVELQSFSIE